MLKFCLVKSWQTQKCFHRERKELTATQTKSSLNTRKQFSSDKSIKSKAEADRRMKEVIVSSVHARNISRTGVNQTSVYYVKILIFIG